jgi:hypothetical protein
MEDRQRFELGTTSSESSASILQQWWALPYAVRASVFKTVIRLSLAATALLIYFIGPADSDGSYRCEQAVDYYVKHCNVTYSRACDERQCILNMCGQEPQYRGPYLVGFKSSDDIYYQYDTEAAVGVRYAIFCLFIAYAIITEFLNRILEDVDKIARVEIKPSMAALAIPLPILAVVVSRYTIRWYIQDLHKVNYAIAEMILLAVIVVLISFKSIRNIDALDKYLEAYRSYRSSPITLEADNLVSFGLRTKDEVLINLLNNRFILKDVSTRLLYKLWFEVIYTVVFSMMFFLSIEEWSRGETVRYSVLMAGVMSIQLLVVSVWQITRFNDEIALIESENEVVTKLKVTLCGIAPSTVMLASFSFSLLTDILWKSFNNAQDPCKYY